MVRAGGISRGQGWVSPPGACASRMASGCARSTSPRSRAADLTTWRGALSPRPSHPAPDHSCTPSSFGLDGVLTRSLPSVLTCNLNPVLKS